MAPVHLASRIRRRAVSFCRILHSRKFDPGKNWEHLQPGEVLKVPNVLPFEIENLGEGKVPENPAFATRKVFVDTGERLLEVFDNDQLVCVFPITPGSKTLPAPRWHVEDSRRNHLAIVPL